MRSQTKHFFYSLYKHFTQETQCHKQLPNVYYMLKINPKHVQWEILNRTDEKHQTNLLNPLCAIISQWSASNIEKAFKEYVLTCVRRSHLLYEKMLAYDRHIH